MINQGLKNYTKQISGNVGRISYHVNPNKECANLILDSVFNMVSKCTNLY